MTIPAYILLTLLGADPLTQSPLVQNLPAVGTSVTYNVQIKAFGKEFAPVWKSRVLGYETYQGKEHQWLEFEQESIANEPEFPASTYKMLIPVAANQEGANPVKSAVRIWNRPNGKETKELGSVADYDINMSQIFSGPTEDLKELETHEQIQWQQGALDCKVIAGTSKYLLFGMHPVVMEHQQFRNDDVPFGIGGGQYNVTVTINGTVHKASMKFTLRETGTDAVSVLPDVRP